MSGIRPADPKLRKRLLILIAVSLVIFIAAETLGLFDFGALFKDLQGEALLQRVRLVFALLFLPLIPMGLYLIHFGLRILRSGEFPPPGAWLIRPTRIQTGRWAGFRGWMAILAKKEPRDVRRRVVDLLPCVDRYAPAQLGRCGARGAVLRLDR